MLLTEQNIPIPCGRIGQPGQIRLSRGYPNECCILFVFDTKGTLRVRGCNYSVPAYASLILPFEETFLPLQSTMPFQWIQLCVHPDMLAEAGFQLGEIRTLAHPLSIAEVCQIVFTSGKSSSEPDLRTQHCAANLLLCLLRRDADAAAEKAAQIPHYEKLAALRREIYRNPAQSWCIQDICEQLCISRPYFHKIYLTAFGISCTQDVIESRIAYAKQLLERTERAVADISQQSGFDSDVYFMRQFKRRTGMTPTAYRRLCRQERTAVRDADEIK